MWDIEDIFNSFDGRVESVEHDAVDRGCATDSDKLSGCVVEAQRAMSGVVQEDIEGWHLFFCVYLYTKMLAQLYSA